MRNQSFSESDFIVDAKQNAQVDGPVQTTGYGPGGKQVDPSSSECLAKMVFDPATGRSRHWLKRISGRLYEPAVDASRPRRTRCEFARATQAAFDEYLLFLETSNPIHLRRAERL